MSKRVLFLFLITLASLVSCQSEVRVDTHEKAKQNSWTFATSANYIFDERFVEIIGGEASLKEIDHVHSSVDFENGTHAGTYLDLNNQLSILEKPTTKLRGLKESWTPRWDKIVWYWSMNGSGNLGSSPVSIDIGGTTCTANGSGMETSYSDESSMADQGLFMTGSDGHLACDSSKIDMLSDTVTISSWIKNDDGAIIPYMPFLEKVTGTRGFSINRSNTSDAVYLRVDTDLTSNGQCAATGKTPLNGLWHHVAFTIDNGTIKAYIDGLLVNTCAYAHGAGFSVPAAGDLVIQRLTTNGSTVLDEMAFWSEALTEEEIFKVYDIQKSNFTELSSLWTPKYSSIIGHWKMDGNWRDSSGLENDANTSGNITSSTETKIGPFSANLNGVDGQIRAPGIADDIDPNKGSFACWVRNEIPDADANNRYLFRYLQSNGDEIFVRFLFNGILQYGYVGSTILASANYSNWDSKVPRSKWSHISGTYDITGNQEIKLFVNGKNVATETQTNSFAAGTFTFFKFGYGTNGFQGKLDDCAVWSEVLDEAEMKTIYNHQKQKYAGNFESEIIDLGVSGEWTSLKVKTALPFMKELPGNFLSESSNDYSSLIGSSGSVNDDDLLSDIVATWHLNESAAGTVGGDDFEDTSGNLNHASILAGTVTFGEEGRFRGSISPGSGHIPVNLPQIDTTPGGWNTVSAWIKWNEANNSEMPFGFTNYGLYFRDGFVGFNTGASDLWGISSSELHEEWVHVVALFYNGSGQSSRLFINGVEKTLSQQIGITGAITVSSNFAISSWATNDTHVWNGHIDEVSIWSRALGDGEIRQLYRRSANRIKYQVRSCDDSACDNELYQGPDGTENTYFSEIHNNDMIDFNGEPTGNVLAATPEITFSDFVTAPIDNRYFQYKVFMESEDQNNLCTDRPCIPQINSVELGPGVRFFGGTPSITTKNPIVYKEIEEISFTESGECEIGHQLSNNGTDYYYWNGSTWDSVNSDLDRNDKVIISSKIKNFSKQYGTGSLYVKSFLKSEENKPCSLIGISLKRI
jgi:hypothetical protein